MKHVRLSKLIPMSDLGRYVSVLIIIAGVKVAEPREPRQRGDSGCFRTTRPKFRRVGLSGTTTPGLSLTEFCCCLYGNLRLGCQVRAALLHLQQDQSSIMTRH